MGPSVHDANRAPASNVNATRVNLDTINSSAGVNRFGILTVNRFEILTVNRFGDLAHELRHHEPPGNETNTRAIHQRHQLPAGVIHMTHVGEVHAHAPVLRVPLTWRQHAASSGTHAPARHPSSFRKYSSAFVVCGDAEHDRCGSASRYSDGRADIASRGGQDLTGRHAWTYAPHPLMRQRAVPTSWCLPVGTVPTRGQFANSQGTCEAFIRSYGFVGLSRTAEPARRV